MYSSCAHCKQVFFTRPSFQEETGYKMARVFPSSSNRPLLFKAHACTSGYHVIDFRQIHWLRHFVENKRQLLC